MNKYGFSQLTDSNCGETINNTLSGQIHKNELPFHKCREDMTNVKCRNRINKGPEDSAVTER